MTLDRDQIDRRKRVVVQQTGDHVHEEHVVQNVNLEYREALYKVSQFIWLLFGALEALIGIRVILMLIGANTGSFFTTLVYQLSDLFLWPFRNIVANPAFQNHVLEITSIIAMIVLATRCVDGVRSGRKPGRCASVPQVMTVEGVDDARTLLR